MSGCKHHGASWRMSESGVHFMWCWQCKDVLPMGPAKLDGKHADAVAIEIRAAELANLAREAEEADERAADATPWYGFDIREGDGWEDHAFDHNPTSAESCEHAAAGWLAREIYEARRRICEGTIHVAPLNAQCNACGQYGVRCDRREPRRSDSAGEGEG